MRDILPSNPYAPRKIRNLTPRGAFTPKGSSTPKGRSTPRTRKSILPRNPRRIAPKATKKNSPLNQLVTRVDRTIVNT